MLNLCSAIPHNVIIACYDFSNVVVFYKNYIAVKKICLVPNGALSFFES